MNVFTLLIIAVNHRRRRSAQNAPTLSIGQRSSGGKRAALSKNCLLVISTAVAATAAAAAAAAATAAAAAIFVTNARSHSKLESKWRRTSEKMLASERARACVLTRVSSALFRVTHRLACSFHLLVARLVEETKHARK